MTLNHATGLHIHHDSGVPKGSSNYTTLVLLHGYAWYSRESRLPMYTSPYHALTSIPFFAAIFARLLPLARQKNLRVVLVNRRDYPGTIPYTPAELALLPESLTTPISGPEELEASRVSISFFMKHRGHELLRFLAEFARTQNIPHADPANNAGGIIVAGWSMGIIWMNALLAHAASFWHDDVNLDKYVRRVILYGKSLFLSTLLLMCLARRLISVAAAHRWAQLSVRLPPARYRQLRAEPLPEPKVRPGRIRKHMDQLILHTREHPEDARAAHARVQASRDDEDDVARGPGGGRLPAARAARRLGPAARHRGLSGGRVPRSLEAGTGVRLPRVGEELWERAPGRRGSRRVVRPLGVGVGACRVDRQGRGAGRRDAGADEVECERKREEEGDRCETPGRESFCEWSLCHYVRMLLLSWCYAFVLASANVFSLCARVSAYVTGTCAHELPLRY